MSLGDLFRRRPNKAPTPSENDILKLEKQIVMDRQRLRELRQQLADIEQRIADLTLSYQAPAISENSKTTLLQDLQFHDIAKTRVTRDINILIRNIEDNNEIIDRYRLGSAMESEVTAEFVEEVSLMAEEAARKSIERKATLHSMTPRFVQDGGEGLSSEMDALKEKYGLADRPKSTEQRSVKHKEIE